MVCTYSTTSLQSTGLSVGDAVYSFPSKSLLARKSNNLQCLPSLSSEIKQLWQSTCVLQNAGAPRGFCVQKLRESNKAVFCTGSTHSSCSITTLCAAILLHQLAPASCEGLGCQRGAKGVDPSVGFAGVAQDREGSWVAELWLWN